MLKHPEIMIKEVMSFNHIHVCIFLALRAWGKDLYLKSTGKL